MKYMNVELLTRIDEVANILSVEYAVEKSCSRMYVVKLFNQHGNLSEKNIYVTLNISDDVNVVWPCLTVNMEKGMDEDSYNALFTGLNAVNPEEVNLPDSNKALHYTIEGNEEIHCAGDQKRWILDAMNVGVELLSKLSKVQRTLDKAKKPSKRNLSEESEDEAEDEE